MAGAESPTSIPSETWTDNVSLWPDVRGANIVFYLVHSKAIDLQQSRNFRSLESYNYLQSGQVGTVLYHGNDDGTCFLKGEVTPSQTVSDRSHCAWVHLQHNGEVLNGGCTCMAGAAKTCSHLGAILWKVEEANRCGLISNSCTGVTAAWNQGTDKNVELARLGDCNFSTSCLRLTINEDNAESTPDAVREANGRKRKWCAERKIGQYFNHEDIKTSLVNNGFEKLVAMPNAILHRVLGSLSTLMMKPFPQHGAQRIPESGISCSPCSEFYSKYVASTCGTNPRTVNQRTALRDCVRSVRITASDANNVPNREGTNPANHLKNREKFHGNASTQHVIEFESAALADFQSKHNAKVKLTGFHICDEDPWLGASPDGLIEEDCILEIKCPTKHLEDLINSNKYALRRDSKGDLYLNKKEPHGYYTQVQLTMRSTGTDKCIFYVWTSSYRYMCDCQL